MQQRHPQRPRTTLGIALAAAFAGSTPGAMAAEPVAARSVVADANAPRISAPRVDVIGSEQNLPLLGGAASTVTASDLRDSKVFTTAEALRKVPGVNVRDEEGFGLRPNIGIRGLNPTRSTKVTLLEDGIPVSYAPYGDNASYYHPAIDRFERIEVLKGANALQFGPQTVGGVINYITPNPPREFGGYVQAIAGNRDYFNGKVNLGGNGFLLDYTRKEGDGARNNLKHEIDDLNLKWVGQLSDRQAITLRGNYYKEDSQLTYSGLTQAEFRNLGPRYNPFRNDTFNAERFGASATHDFDFGNGAVLTTNLYYAYFTRDWVRQASNSQDAQCQASYNANTGRNFNADRLAGIAVNPDLCNSTQGRLRDYTTYGIEPRLLVSNRLGEFQMGVKAHFEEQDRLQLNANASRFDPKSPATGGATLTTAEDNLRKVDAYSGFVAQRFDLGRFAVTPIVRYESIESRRSNRLNGTTGAAKVTETSPGIGATWNPNPDWTVFTSLYEGFAPPRVEDLIGGTGTVADVDPERSTNFELGLRARPVDTVSFQAAYFRNNFDNLIAVGNIAGGSTPLSQGKALFEGVEFSGRVELGRGFSTRLAYTWLPTAEQDTPFVEVANPANQRGAAGNRLAYAPKHTATAGLGYRHGPFRAEVEVQHVGDQFSDFNESRAPSANGQIGEIASYTLVNATASYQLAPKGATLFVTAKNLTDRTYIVDRTRGIQVGMPLLVQAGVRYDF